VTSSPCDEFTCNLCPNDAQPRPFRGASLFYISCVPYVALQCPRSFPIGLLQQSPVWSTLSSVSNLFRTCGSANIQNSAVRTHYPSSHQPSLAARPRTSPSNYLQSCFTRVSDMKSRRRLRSSTLHPLTSSTLVEEARHGQGCQAVDRPFQRFWNDWHWTG